MSTTKSGLVAVRPSVKKAAEVKAAEAKTKKGPTKRINVELPAAARTKLKMHALKTGKTVTDIIGEFIAKLPD